MYVPVCYRGFLSGSVIKNLPANAGATGSIPESGRSPGEGNGNSLLYSPLGNPMERGARWATVKGSQKSQTWLTKWLHNTNNSVLYVFHCDLTDHHVLNNPLWLNKEAMAFLVLSLPPSLIFSVRLVIFSVLVLHLKNEFDNAFLLLPSMSYVCG